jgi:anti-sigma regulatory factor (Ser/Thr protein kinase)
VSTLSASFELPPAAVSIRSVRRLVSELMLVWRAPHEPCDASLLVTELVANVVDHVGGGTTMSVEVLLSGDWLRIGVVDGSPVRPVVRPLDPDQPRGRGLRLVETVADRWGCEEHEGGKRVWFELRPPM